MWVLLWPIKNLSGIFIYSMLFWFLYRYQSYLTFTCGRAAFFSNHSRRPHRHGAPDGGVYQHHRQLCVLDNISSRQCHLRQRGGTLHCSFFPTAGLSRWWQLRLPAPSSSMFYYWLVWRCWPAALNSKNRNSTRTQPVSLQPCCLWLSWLGSAVAIQNDGRHSFPWNEPGCLDYLGIVYILSLIYTLVTHRHMFVVERQPRRKPRPLTGGAPLSFFS